MAAMMPLERPFLLTAPMGLTLGATAPSLSLPAEGIGTTGSVSKGLLDALESVLAARLREVDDGVGDAPRATGVPRLA